MQTSFFRYQNLLIENSEKRTLADDLNPIEKYDRQIVSFPQIGVKKINICKTHHLEEDISVVTWWRETVLAVHFCNDQHFFCPTNQADDIGTTRMNPWKAKPQPPR